MKSSAPAENKTKTVAELVPAEYNPRKITDAQLKILGRALAEFGDLGGVVFNTKTSRLIGGHQRLKHLKPEWKINSRVAADKTGTVAVGTIETPWGEMAYREVAWDETKEKAANIAANKIGGDFATSQLTDLLGELNVAGFDLSLTGFGEAELKKLIGWSPNGMGGGSGQDEVPIAPKEAKTKPGDLWELGAHRLLCADATTIKSAEKIMDGNKAAMMWTDPPYGVDYTGKTKDALKIKNDQAEGLERLLREAFGAADVALGAGSGVYVAHPAGARQVTFLQAFVAAGWRLHQSLVWVKDTMVLGHSDYHYRHEPILYGYTAGDGRRGRGGAGWNGGNDATSIFEVPKPTASEKHPTMKPVELIEPMVCNSSKIGDLVYDPFAGSGSTVIACEKTGRKARAIEIDPVYCDVAIERWQNFTGKKAKRTR